MVFRQLLDANDDYVRSFSGTAMPAPPRRQLAILTCMDARIDTWAAFGLGMGDVHVIRNAGARASDDALRSLAVSHHILGARYVAVVGHTECGMALADDAALQERIGAAAGVDLSGMAFLTIADTVETVREDVATLVASPLLGGMEIAGFVYDVRSGSLEQVIEPQQT
jgi:carbonic anhydrase